MINFENPYTREQLPDITNEMQAGLALRRSGFDSDDAVIKWIEKYSPMFRQLIEARPEYVKEYESDPEGVLGQIEKEIYKGEKAEKKEA